MDMPVALPAYDEDAGRRVPLHLAVQAPGDLVYFQKFKREVAGAKLADPFDRELESFFLLPCEAGVFRCLHTGSLLPFFLQRIYFFGE
jgi:hypothetical protein